MRILILGAGKMGTFFADLLSSAHECAVYDTDPGRLRFLYNTLRFTSLSEIGDFAPELVVNAVTLRHTLSVFEQVIPHLPADCILSDISSVKTGFLRFYQHTGRRFVSTHPMFGPTFAHLGALTSENAIVITEGDYMGRLFFLDLYRRLGLHVREYTFEEHDQSIAYSLSVPFVSTFAFAATMKHQDAPGTTFKRHMAIAKGVLGEDDTLLCEILFNPHTLARLDEIEDQLALLRQIIAERDEEAMHKYLGRLRRHIE